MKAILSRNDGKKLELMILRNWSREHIIAELGLDDDTYRKVIRTWRPRLEAAND